MSARFLGLCCLLFGLAVHLLQPAFAAEPRVALVIGNSNYGPAIGKLLNPANDARLMADTLKGLGFSVDLVLDADQKTMKRAIKAFGAKLEESGKDTTGLFYYAGHGVQVEGTNFLLPVGAEIEREADVEIESISADDVMTQMQFAGNAVNLVFLDACRNNPLAKANRSGTRGLARLDAPRGSFVGYSTAPGDVAADGDGANSPYALALADELKKPGISVEEAHRNVRARVLAETGSKQTPWDSSSLTGAVILAAKAASPAPAPASQPVAEQQAAVVDKEVVFWESIKGSADPADFEAYISQYPQGTFLPLAKNKIAALKPAAPVAQQPALPAEPQAAGTPTQIVVSTDEQAQIDKYLRNVADTGKAWALAIRKDGSKVAMHGCAPGAQNSFPGCAGVGATPMQDAKEAAMKKCGPAADCILLYENDRKVANVEIVAQSAALQPAPAAPTGAKQIVVTAEVKERLDVFERKCASGSTLCFVALSHSGDSIAYGSSQSYWTPAYTDQQRRSAISTCGGPTQCFLLYDGSRKAGVEIVTQQVSLQPSQAEQQVDAPAQGSIGVTSDVMGQIEDYVKSAAGKSGKFNALAIARDGTSVARYTCSSAQCPGGSSSDRQEIANKQAINSCGGYGKCVLLYEGDRNVADLTPVVQ